MSYPFVASKEGLYIIEISARARGEKQIGKDATNDDDLRIEIDGRKFPKLDNPQRYLDTPAAFSGGQLHNLKKTVFFFIQLSKGKHAISFIPDGVPLLEEVTIGFAGANSSKIDLNINQQAEDGDRRPWITFVLVDLPLAKIQSVIKAERRFLDSDDVKIVIDDEIKRNLKNGLRKFWFWLGSVLKGEEQTNTFDVDLKRGLHYVEFWADRTPTLQSISFDFGEVVKRIPNVHDPEWTGDFHDDTEEIFLARILFGEARNQSRKTKAGVGWAVKNRIGKGNVIYHGRVYSTYHDVILDKGQYASLSDPSVRPRMEDPLGTQNIVEIRAWYESYEVAKEVIAGIVSDPTHGALFFHDNSMTEAEFLRAVPRAVYTITIGDILFYGARP